MILSSMTVTYIIHDFWENPLRADNKLHFSWTQQKQDNKEHFKKSKKTINYVEAITKK